MFNPLATDPGDLSDDELQEKISELGKKLVTASRFPDQSLVQQIHVLLSMYNEEQQRRYRSQMQRQQQKDKDSGEDLGELINVN